MRAIYYIKFGMSEKSIKLQSNFNSIPNFVTSSYPNSFPPTRIVLNAPLKVVNYLQQFQYAIG